MTIPTLGRRLAAGAVLMMVLPAFAGTVMVTDLKGVVLLKGRKQPVALLEELPPDRMVILKAGARITLVNMATGGESSFSGPGKLKLDAKGEAHGLAPGQHRAVASLQGSVHLRPGSLAQAAVVMRDVDRKPEPTVFPADPFCLSATPEFRWQAAGTKASYHFRLQDPQGQVLFELTQDECSVQVPEHLALADGTAYTWVLETTLADGSRDRRSGQLAVLAKPVRDQLQAARPGPGAPFSDRLVYAALLEQVGLHQEARAFWRGLAHDHPEDPGLARLAAN